LIEISIHTAIPGKIVGRSKEPLNELKDLLEQVCENSAHLIIYQKPNYFKCTKSTKPLRLSVNYC
jgi:ribosomal protein S3